jgi:uncharacterized protein YjiS (DUF1127 family)
MQDPKHRICPMVRSPAHGEAPRMPLRGLHAGERTMRPILTSVSDVHGAMRFDPGERQAKAAGRAQSRPGLRNLIATWKDRGRFRWELACMARDMPELIDDIGLTMAEVNTEIAKPFWRP